MSEPKEIAVVLPLGFCTECLKALKGEGKFSASHTVRDGTCFSSFFCYENEVGGVLIERPGQPPEWLLRRPITVEGQMSALRTMIAGHEALKAMVSRT
jgi:hypothetical protein